MRSFVLCIAAIAAISVGSSLADEFPKPFNSGVDKAATPPLTPEEAVKKIRLPAGFKATLFAGEPDVQNPIACAWDSRGRLWIAENYTYAEADKMFDHSLRDRILIFEDTDNDGRHDKRTVFADNLKNLTSIELGYGGVYATAAPHLLFIPDKNRDDKPDAAPEVLLDGFDEWGARHNFVNGLKWGPDGWLYGRHGILATSNVGRPGAPDSERVKFNCCIWRFHPVQKTVEVVTWGGTNAWGHDWNAEGEGFFINTVIGHLYHIISGAHYERMYGEDLHPHIYELLPQTADHHHYDTSRSWTESRDGKANDLGGGHAHSGLMIYQGENWPEQYRGKVFTINLHGRRINVERLERKGSGYTAKHEPDFAFFDDPWFRGVDLTYGPDGGVYVLDWSDQGECHENDGVHRTSGRIYKITFGDVEEPRFSDLAAQSTEALLDLVTSRNEWLSRQARQLLAQSEVLSKDLVTEVTRRLWQAPTTAAKLRLLWALHGNAYMKKQPGPNTPEDLQPLIAKLPPREEGNSDPDSIRAKAGVFAGVEEHPILRQILKRAMHDTSEHAQHWAIRLVTDWHLDPIERMEGRHILAHPFTFKNDEAWADLTYELTNVSSGPTTPLVLRSLLDVYARSTGSPRRDWTKHLDALRQVITEPSFPKDTLTTIYLWQVIRTGISDDENRVDLVGTDLIYAPLPDLILNNFGRLFATAHTHQLNLDGLFADLAGEFDRTAEHKLDMGSTVERVRHILLGVRTGLRGVAKTEPPQTWPEFVKHLTRHPQLEQVTRDLNVIFGDGRALDEIRDMALDEKADLPARRQALETLITSKAPDLRRVSEKLITHRDLAHTAIRGLAMFDDPAAAKLAIANWNTVRWDAHAAVISDFATRPVFTRALLDAIAAGKIEREELTPYHARQIAALNNPEITAQLTKVWGDVRTTTEEKKKRITELKAALPPEVLAKADLQRGREVFTQACAACHRLFDLGAEGTQLGPNLTGSGRQDISYLLENIVDPNALVPADYKLSIITTKDGRTLSGFISAQNEQTLTLRTMTDTQTIPKADVAKTETSPNSLMPEGLLDALSVEQVRDLFGFLMKK